MISTNVLVLDRRNLIKKFKDLAEIDIDITHFNRDIFNEIKKADLVLFRETKNDKLCRILKTRFTF